MFLVLRRIEATIASKATGTTFGGISTKELAKQLVPIAPSAEQRLISKRVMDLFSEVADGMAALSRARDDLDAWCRALLRAAVTGELTREWRDSNRANQTGTILVQNLRRERALDEGEFNFRSALELNTVPDTWAWTRVGTAGDVRLGRQRAPDFHSGRHMRPYLRVANVFEDRLDLSDVKSMNFTPVEQKIFELKSGDVLLNEGQSPKFLGRPAIYRGEISGCCFQNTLLRFRPREGVLSEYALIVFRHYMMSGRFQREARITTNIAHLSQNRFVEIEFPIPPTKEQSEIVRLVFEAEGEGREAFEQLSVADLSALRQSILKAAFEGQLVKQDPRDEPAEAMLARIDQPSPAKKTKVRRARTSA